VRRGSREAAGRLAERYLRPGRAVALAITGDVAAAEDLAQDAFVYAMERIDDCRHPERFGSWLMQIVRSRSRNYVRDSKPSSHAALDDVVSGAPSPHAEVERAQLRRRLLSALDTLSEVQREVVLLHDLEGWTHREIAARLGMPAGTVRSHVHHARRSMRAQLREMEE
jgi:RNA polymerase sigma-70 factor (ECF subfamily)